MNVIDLAEKLISDDVAHNNRFKSMRKSTPHRIKWMGEYLELRGKTVWKRIGDAKVAFRRYFDQTITLAIQQDRDDDKYYPKDEEIKGMILELMNRGTLQFVPLVEETK